MTTIHKRGNLRGDKVLYKDGVNYCVWYPAPPWGDDPSDDDEASGICFDIRAEDVLDLIGLLEELVTADPDVYEEKGETT